jgi:DNA-directed RNA polymerase specialized sigma subunit
MPKREDSIDEFIKNATDFMSQESEQRYNEYRGRRGKELQLWSQWHQSGKKEEHLEPLLQSMKPLIRSEAQKRMTGLGGSIPRSALENELTNAAVKSLHSYDPSKGTALSTHVTGGFQRVSDFVNANRNAKYVPGEDMKRFDRFRNAHAELEEELGRAPHPHELVERLPGYKLKQVQKMQRSFGAEAYTDMGDGLSPDDNFAQLTPRDAFQLTRSRLNEQEQRFGEMFFPAEGEKQPAIKNIAKALGIPQHKAYRLKERVERTVGPVLKRE